jgi:hypothetical protein
MEPVQVNAVVWTPEMLYEVKVVPSISDVAGLLLLPVRFSVAPVPQSQPVDEINVIAPEVPRR